MTSKVKSIVLFVLQFTFIFILYLHVKRTCRNGNDLFAVNEKNLTAPHVSYMCVLCISIFFYYSRVSSSRLPFPMQIASG